MDANLLKYPAGKYQTPENISPTYIETWKKELKDLPQNIRSLVDNVPAELLKNRYRPDGWTIQQVIHHIADSHSNALIRFKLALTEENPTIKPYIENKWADLADYDLPVIISLHMIDSIHTRWLAILESMEMHDFEKTFYHPEHKKDQTLKYILGLYAWHGRHHAAHIQNALSNPF